MFSDKDLSILCVIAVISFVIWYQSQEHFGDDVSEYPFHPRRKVATKYKWDHGCYGRDYGCYDRNNCRSGDCNKTCWGSCRRPVKTRWGKNQNYYTNCYDGVDELKQKQELVEKFSTTINSDNHETDPGDLIHEPTPSPTPDYSTYEPTHSPTHSPGDLTYEPTHSPTHSPGDLTYEPTHSPTPNLFEPFGNSYQPCGNNSDCNHMHNQVCKDLLGHKHCGLADRFPQERKQKIECFESCDNNVPCDNIFCTASGGRCHDNKGCVVTNHHGLN
jgi:hypothetical protein